MGPVVNCLKALAEPARLRLARLCAGGDLTVGELTQVLGISQPGVSRHLKVLTEAGLLERFREGSRVFCRVAGAGAARDLLFAVLAALPGDDADLMADDTRLARIRAERTERAHAYFARVAADWDRIRAWQADEAVVDRAVREIAAAGRCDSLLDVGTGTGRVLMLLADLAKRAEGIDLSPEMLAVARENLARAGLTRCLVRQGDMYHLPSGTDGYDLVVFRQVLHYAARPVLAVREAARVLAPGGRVVIVDFLPHDLEVLRTEHNHVRLGFSPEEVAGWFRDCGLMRQDERVLPGKPLTVGVWAAGKTGDRE